MLFVIIGYDGPNGAALRPSVRPAHLENLQPLVDAGRVVVGGPFTDGSGSLMVADFERRGRGESLRANRSLRHQGRLRTR